MNNAYGKTGMQIVERLSEQERKGLLWGSGLVSYFQAPINAKENLNPYMNYDLESIANFIKSDALREVTAHIRELGTGNREQGDRKKEMGQLKMRCLPAITIAGTFVYRRQDGLAALSGYVGIDLDGLDDPEKVKEMLKKDKEFPPLLLFVSPSGRGLKAVYRCMVSESWSYEDWYLFYSAYLSRTYGLTVDRACKDVGRLCYLCYDENVYVYNE